ncbi:MAG: hypothetical protein P8L85_03750 [Rubripirellula sp.]|nr:hypothetical protein [Rubripirellula sp.]
MPRMPAITLLPAILSLSCALIITGVWEQENHAWGQASNTRITPPDGNGQLETPPALFGGGFDPQGRRYFFNGQPARNQKLILTASNGFFDHGTCRAGGESSLPKVGDDSLIKPNYAFLDHWNTTDGTIRWHLWFAKPGTVRLNVHLQVSEREAGSRLNVSLAGKSRTVTTVASAASTPQPWNLTFRITEPGEQTVSLSAATVRNSISGVG